MLRRPAIAISLYVRGRAVLVVGETPAASGLRQRLEEAGATVRAATTEQFRGEMCDSCYLVAAHAVSEAQNRAIAGEARKYGCLVYAHDVPDVSDFSMPARVQRGPITIAISTDGVAPTLARRLRIQLNDLVESAGEQIDALVATLSRYRDQLPPGPARTATLTRTANRLAIAGRIEISPPHPQETPHAP